MDGNASVEAEAAARPVLKRRLEIFSLCPPQKQHDYGIKFYPQLIYDYFGGLIH